MKNISPSKIFKIIITSRSGKKVLAFYAGETKNKALHKAYEHNKSLQSDFSKYQIA